MNYASDVTDAQWLEIEGFFERSDPRGAVCKHTKREIFNAILYIVKTGAQWRMLPKNFPPWETVYNHFWRLNRRGIWEQILYKLNTLVRKKAGKNKYPSYAVVDSQSVKTQYSSEQKGYDGNKKNKG